MQWFSVFGRFLENFMSQDVVPRPESEDVEAEAGARPGPGQDAAAEPWWAARLRGLNCEHFIFLHVCEECGVGLNRVEVRLRQREARACMAAMQAERRAKVKALNGNVGEAQGKRKRRRAHRKARRGQAEAETLDPVPETPARPRKVRFNLEDVPKPVKDREFLYRDFAKDNEGMLEQWTRRLESLRGSEAKWRKELEELAAKRGWRAAGLEHTDRRLVGRDEELEEED